MVAAFLCNSSFEKSCRVNPVGRILSHIQGLPLVFKKAVMFSWTEVGQAAALRVVFLQDKVYVLRIRYFE